MMSFASPGQLCYNDRDGKRGGAAQNDPQKGYPEMKRLISLLAALCLCFCGALAAESDDVFTLWFEDGFSLSIPEGWVLYPTSAQQAADGIRYILGDGQGGRYLHIRMEDTDLRDFEALRAGIEAREDCSKPNELSLNGQPFASFVLRSANASGCATLHNGQLLTFLFTPQDDQDYMLLLAKIMASFSTKV